MFGMLQDNEKIIFSLKMNPLLPELPTLHEPGFDFHRSFGPPNFLKKPSPEP